MLRYRASVTGPRGLPRPVGRWSTTAAVTSTSGLHAVGIDRIIATAGVTRATLYRYRHFPSKEDLLVAYLTAGDEAIRARTAAVRAAGSAAAPSSTPRPSTPTPPIPSTGPSSGTGNGSWTR